MILDNLVHHAGLRKRLTAGKGRPAHAARPVGRGASKTSGRHMCGAIPVKRAAFGTNSAGSFAPFRSQLLMFCWLVPMASAKRLWLPLNGSAATAF